MKKKNSVDLKFDPPYVVVHRVPRMFPMTDKLCEVVKSGGRILKVMDVSNIKSALRSILSVVA